MTRSFVCALLLLSAVLPVAARDAGGTLDAFHQAAADADLSAYVSLMTDDIVFLGTDAEERWEGEEFRRFARPHFESGKGWEYRPVSRNIAYSADGSVAWFDEMLDHDKLGQCRGSGVLLRDGQHWKVAQYNLSVPVPNELLLGVVEQIQEGQDAEKESPDAEKVSESEQSAAVPSSCRKKRHKTNRPAGC